MCEAGESVLGLRRGRRGGEEAGTYVVRREEGGACRSHGDHGQLGHVGRGGVLGVGGVVSAPHPACTAIPGVVLYLQSN